MTRLVSPLDRRPAPVAKRRLASAPQNSEPAKDQIELDHELFLPIATQLSHNNAPIGNLLIDAEHKLGELETVEHAIGRLADPVSKTPRSYEEAENAKLNLQGALNSTRIARHKLRAGYAAAQNNAASFETEAERLREILSVAQQSVAALEETKAEQIAELAARRSHVTELQHGLQQQDSDLRQTRADNLRLRERIASADRRAVRLQDEAQAANQKAMQSAQENAALQAHSTMIEQLLEEAHATLIARADEIQTFERRLDDAASAHSNTSERLAEVTAALAEREDQIKDLKQAHAAVSRHNQMLAGHVGEHEAANESTQQRIKEQAELVQLLKDQIKTMQAASKIQIEQLTARLQGERSAAFQEANQKYRNKITMQNARFKALQTHSTMIEQLLEEAHAILIAGADEIRTLKLRLDDTASAHGNTSERLTEVTAALAESEVQIKDLEQAHTAVSRCNQMLAGQVGEHEAANESAQQRIKEQADLVHLLEDQIKTMQASSKIQIEQLTAALRREQLERTTAEGALEAGRKEVAWLRREIGALQRRPNLQAAPNGPAAIRHLRSVA